MDLVLTGRAVGAEAHAMGLVNRLCRSRRRAGAAVRLAHEIAGLPQTCLRQDRLSVLEQWGLVEQEAMGVELAHGLVSLQSDALAGASRFASGAGRHGAPAERGRILRLGAPSGEPTRRAKLPARRTGSQESDAVSAGPEGRPASISRGRCAERG